MSVSSMETKRGVTEYEKGAVLALLEGVELQTGGTVESETQCLLLMNVRQWVEGDSCEMELE